MKGEVERNFSKWSIKNNWIPSSWPRGKSVSVYFSWENIKSFSNRKLIKEMHLKAKRKSFAETWGKVLVYYLILLDSVVGLHNWYHFKIVIIFFINFVIVFYFLILNIHLDNVIFIYNHNSDNMIIGYIIYFNTYITQHYVAVILLQYINNICTVYNIYYE